MYALSRSEVEFSVQGRTCIATVNINLFKELTRELKKKLRQLESQNKLCLGLVEYFNFTKHSADTYKPNRYYASATCSPEDEFDLETGYKIAFMRLVEKIDKDWYLMEKDMLVDASMFFTAAKEVFLHDCDVAGRESTRRYSEVIDSFMIDYDD